MTNAPQPPSEPSLCELAELYALGLLDGDEAAAFEGHVASGCPRCVAAKPSLAAVVTGLGLSAPAVAPPAGARERLMARVRAQSAESPPPAAAPSIHFLFSDDDAWEPTEVEGFSVRTLFRDDEHDRTTSLVRLAPGTRYPRHRHVGVEECLVLDGDLRTGDVVMRKGDYQRADGGSVHEEHWTEDGCVLLIHSTGGIEPLEPATA